MAHNYDDSFFDWVDSGARRSAREMIPVVRQFMHVDSVVDIGCGRGTWLAVWAEHGITDILGLDGDYVDRNKLQIPADKFVAADLNSTFSVPREFALAQSLEVGEHLPEASAMSLVRSLCLLSDVVLFSAAVPGQGGERHINEQEYGWWRDNFAAAGYSMFDCIRPAVFDNQNIEPWYRFNAFIYASAEGEKRLSEGALATRVPANSQPRDVSNMGWRIRRLVLRPLPQRAVSSLSRANYLLRTHVRGLFGSRK